MRVNVTAGRKGSATTTAVRAATRTANQVSPPVWVAITIFCIGLFWITVPTTIEQYHVSLLVAYPVATVQSVSIALAARWWRSATAVHLGAVIVFASLTRGRIDELWPLPVTALIALGALLAVIGLGQRWATTLIVWWTANCVLVLLVVSAPDQLKNNHWGTNLFLYFTCTLLVVAAAVTVGQRRAIQTQLAEARRDVELEQAKNRYVQERARIARELHDVVAHSMSIIHMQAMSAPFRLGGLAPETATEFSDIARSARTALSEMRQLLGALRDEDDRAELAPQPQIGNIPQLVASMRRTGTDVQWQSSGPVETLSPVVQLTAYRIAQEALSNVVRHAPGAAASVVVSVEADSLSVVVDNGPVAHGTVPPTPDPSGYGLRGMRERLLLMDGELINGGTAAGGYHLQATIPVGVQHRRPEMTTP